MHWSIDTLARGESVAALTTNAATANSITSAARLDDVAASFAAVRALDAAING